MDTVRYKLEGDKIIAIHRVPIAKFETCMDYTPDPTLKLLIQQWQDSPKGIFIEKNAIKIEMITENDPQMYRENHWIVTEIEEKKLLEYYLKFDKPDFS